MVRSHTFWTRVCTDVFQWFKLITCHVTNVSYLRVQLVGQKSELKARWKGLLKPKVDSTSTQTRNHSARMEIPRQRKFMQCPRHRGKDILVGFERLSFWIFHIPGSSTCWPLLLFSSCCLMWNNWRGRGAGWTKRLHYLMFMGHTWHTISMDSPQEHRFCYILNCKLVGDR